jgi:hypothetical protein
MRLADQGRIGGGIGWFQPKRSVWTVLVGLHEDARPAGVRQCPAERPEQGAGGGLEPGACYLPTQHGELVAEHQDLQVLGGVAAGQQDDQLDRAAECQIGELRQYAGSLRDESVEASHYRAMVERTGSSEAISDFTHPTGRGVALAPGVQRVVDGQLQLQLALVVQAERGEPVGDRLQPADCGVTARSAGMSAPWTMRASSATAGSSMR